MAIKCKRIVRDKLGENLRGDHWEKVVKKVGEKVGEKVVEKTGEKVGETLGEMDKLNLCLLKQLCAEQGVRKR